MRFRSIITTAAVLSLVLAGGVQAQGRGHDRDRHRGDAPPPPPPPPPVEQQHRSSADQQRQAEEQQERIAEERAREAAARAAVERERAEQQRAAQLQAEARRNQSLAQQQELARERQQRELSAEQQRAAQLQAEARRSQSLAQERELARERQQRELAAERNRERERVGSASPAARPVYRYYRAGRYFYTDRSGAFALRRAVRYGYQEGYRAGDLDQAKGRPFDFRHNFLYRDADYGYNGGYISLFDYNDYFREGFWRGYQDGYYQRNQYGYLFGGVPTIYGPTLSSILPFGFIP